MAFYLGIDAGGTKAEYALANEQMTLARAKGGSIKRMRVDAETAALNLHSALLQLETASGVAMSRVSATCIGTAGEKVPLVTDWLTNELCQYVTKSPLIKGDVEIALEAAFPGRPGILVLAGTGSNVLGRSPSGELYSAGGYGPVLSDQGSGHCIGVHTLRAMFLARDEDRETQLFEAVKAHWKLFTLTGLIAYANACPPTEYSSLGPIVVQCAKDGDEVAQAVLEEEARQLSYLIVQVARKLRENGKGEKTLQFALAGSILQTGVLREFLLSELQKVLPENEHLDRDVDPVAGALAFARRSVDSA